ncbi:MAG: hypothetical protein LBS01_06160 [Prevotellaceae bacterium]|jgi:hypothetical protein|nr:hypothetical protein [Prevotellaceae bacterium]
MAKVILKYDARNPHAVKTLEFIMSLGFFEMQKTDDPLSPFEKSLQDIKNGRVTKIKNVYNAVSEILQ